MQYALLIAVSLIMPLPRAAVADSLNKCIDADGRITYSNLPCTDSREVHKLAIDPPPQPAPLPKAQPARPERAHTGVPAAASEPRLETHRSPGKAATQATANKCNSIADKLGRVFDKMDTARRQGYTQAQMNDWNQQIRDLERQKQQAGCF